MPRTMLAGLGGRHVDTNVVSSIHFVWDYYPRHACTYVSCATTNVDNLAKL